MNDEHHTGDCGPLIDAMLDDALTPEQHAALEAALAHDPAARRDYFRRVDLHLDLQTLLGSSARTEPLARLDSTTRPARGARWVRYAMAAAVFLAALLGILPLLDTHVPTAPAAAIPPATLIQQAGAKFYGLPLAPPTGTPLTRQTPYVLTEGQVQLAFASGAEAIITAPAVFEVDSPMRLVMRVGRCSVHAEGPAEGFTVDTPTTQVIDRGTRFSVDVEESGHAVVQVAEGLTEVFEPGGVGAGGRLEAGRAVRFGEGEPRDVRFDPARFIGRLPDRIVRYTTTTGPRGGARDLVDVTVQRGGRVVAYRAEDLIGVRLTHFVGAGTRVHWTSPLDTGEAPSRAAALDGDRDLNTGVINPGGAQRPLEHDPEDATPGFAVRFNEPVVNGDGPDIVLFELQVVVHPPDGDAFHVGPVRFAPGLHTHTVRRFDIHLLSPEAAMLEGYRLYTFDEPIASLEKLARSTDNGGPEYTVPSRLLAVGIDLSDLGYAPGAAASELFFQDALDDVNYLDPVLIGGLPPTHEAKEHP